MHGVEAAAEPEASTETAPARPAPGLAGAIGNRGSASLSGRGLAGPSAALASAIGNRAFASLQRPALQRCGCRGACGCRGTVAPRVPALGLEPELNAIRRAALARRAEPDAAPAARP